MILDVEINPRGIADAYLDGLNRSFGGWGDRATYHWDFEREVGARQADLMVLRDVDRIVAGSAVSYRTVRYRGDDLLVGIMTGSWTLPEARGQGAFSLVIEESRRLVARRGGSLLIAFVTRDNASRRRLVAAGCLEVPTWYVASGADTAARATRGVVERSRATVDELFRAHSRWQGEGTGAVIVYPSRDVWASQYLERPDPVEVLLAAGSQCVVEHASVSDRVLWISGPDLPAAVGTLLVRAAAQGRQLFLFAAEPGLAELAVGLGMTAKPGSITVLDALGGSAGVSDPARLPAEWRLQGGDRA